jgi:hypothetical protein
MTHTDVGAEDLQRMDGKRRRRLPPFRVLGIVACILAVIVAIVVWRAWSSRAKRYADMLPFREYASSVAADKEWEARIEAFCSDCHGWPRPENYHRDAWHDKVRRGYEFYAKSGRKDLDPPPMHQAVAYFVSRAPERTVFPESEEAGSELRAKFKVETFTPDRSAPLPPAVSHLLWAPLKQDGMPVLLACDMRQGTVTAVDLRDRPLRPILLARLNHPSHVQPCDLDGNHAIDLIVADLGSFFPDDHDRGRVVWLRPEPASSSYEQVVLASGLGRVADVRPADFDRDGDLDLIVAEFGAEQTGGILLLRNVSVDGGRPRYELEKIDPRPGAIHVPVHDLNGDGHLDFVALVSQHYECVEAFINQGAGQFHLRTLWAGPDPAFGVSGIELVDLDQDSDTDILLTNGDAFDDGFVKLCHRVQWLENLGDLQFAHRPLTDLPGAYRALAGDIDLDGDLDVVAMAWLPRRVWPLNVVHERLASIVCLERVASGDFVRHTLETGFSYHAAFEMADFDDDGDLDLAVGSHTMASSHQLPLAMAIWWNQVISED